MPNKIDSKDILFNIIRPLQSILIFNYFEQEIKLDIMEQLPHEQGFDNKIGVIDLETYTIENSDLENKKTVENSAKRSIVIVVNKLCMLVGGQLVKINIYII